MEKDIENYYKSYQKNSDSVVLETYFTLLSKEKNNKSEESELLEIRNRIIAIKQVINERELELKQLQVGSETDQKGNLRSAFNDYLRDGVKSIFIGVVIFVISLGFMYKFQGNTICYIGIIIGGFKFLQGIIELAVGLYIRVSHANKFR